MKMVKVVNCTNPNFWYAYLPKGTLLNVYPTKISSYGKLYYRVVNMPKFNMLLAVDVEEVSDMSPTSKSDNLNKQKETKTINKAEQQEKGIKISYKDVIDHGIKVVQIIDFNLLPIFKLPKEYLKSMPTAYLNEKKELVINTKEFAANIPKDSFVNPNQFDTLIDALKKCGHNLTTINKKLHSVDIIKTITI